MEEKEMFNKYKKEKEIAIKKINKNDSFVLSTEGTIAIVGNEIDVMSDITFLIKNLYEQLPKKKKKMIVSAIITSFKGEEEISDESEELAQKVLDKIKELK